MAGVIRGQRRPAVKASPVHLVFGNESFADHEQIVFCRDRDSGLSAIIALHDTTFGPAMGGTRMWPYESEAAALRDVLRLAHGMTYKNALAGVGFGGGKAVILGDPKTDKTPELMRAFGRAIDRLGGNFITGEDVGIGVPDAEEIRKATPHVRGIAEGRAGDPSPHTAFGVYKGLQAAARHRLGSAKLDGVSVCIQGLGHVGLALAELLHDAGARLLVSDIDKTAVKEAAQRFGATFVVPDKAHAAPCEVFAPCALGGVLNARSIPEIRALVVAGCANNQLEAPEDGARLMERGILYAPDYVINAGGVISISHEGPDFDLGLMRRDVARIADTLGDIFKRADAESLPTSVVADRMAEERLAAGRKRRAAA